MPRGGASLSAPLQASLETESLTRLLCLGVGLLYIGRQGEADLALELAKAVPGEAGAYCAITREALDAAAWTRLLDPSPGPVSWTRLSPGPVSWTRLLAPVS